MNQSKAAERSVAYMPMTRPVKPVATVPQAGPGGAYVSTRSACTGCWASPR
ncbi:hypothetical protein ACIBG4_28835 [Nonomuraea sp. NPDC050383]|uniref:hypothetical protein n=1 Tax=Nonomuraea sp. NPDC050383 TaxID=3364362 RepID=UPI00379C5C79